MAYTFISKESELQKLVELITNSEWVSLDTEFISEGRYFPLLCLAQVATPEGLYLIDAPSLDNMSSFWDALGTVKEIIVHAFRGEMEFFYRTLKRMPDRVFDVQLAAGMLGYDYPAGFGSLLEQLLQVSLSKAESRTDWLRRPLSSRQIEYALDDVRYLHSISVRLKKELQELGRENWYIAEQQCANEKLKNSLDNPACRNLPKSGRLSPREMSVARELIIWRDESAERANRPRNWVLRDDLILELAKQQSTDPKRISEIRGIKNSNLQSALPEIIAAIKKGLESPEASNQMLNRESRIPQYSLQTQILQAALYSICEEKKISSQLVGTTTDVRELIAAFYGSLPEDTTPRLKIGWRSEIVGNVLDDLLNGKIAVRLKRSTEESAIEFV